MEATNKQIKDTHSLRERLPFNKFVLWAEEMIELDWSAGRPKPSEVQKKIMPKLFVNARQLHNFNRPVFVLRANERFAVVSSEQMGLVSRQVKEAARLIFSDNFETADIYLEMRFKVCLF